MSSSHPTVIDFPHPQNHSSLREEAIPRFLNDMETRGARPKDRGNLELRLRSDTETIRFDIDGETKGKKSGACCLFNGDGPVVNGWFQNHKIHGDAQSFSYRPQGEPTITAPTVKKAPMGEALKLLKKAVPASPDHPYLKRKKVSGKGILEAEIRNPDTRQEEVHLVIKACDENGNFKTLQTIPPGEGKKRFFTGLAKKGAFHIISGDKAKVILCEGYATGATISELTDYEVIVCFDAGNLKEVASILPQKTPDREYIVFADNDWKTDGNPGLTKAKETGLPYIYPTFNPEEDGTDWNDFYIQHGEGKAKKEIKKQLKELGKRVFAIPPHRFPDLSPGGRPQGTIENLKFLLDHYKIKASYDEIQREIGIDIPGTSYSQDNKRNADLAHIISLAVKCGMPKGEIASYIIAISDENRVNPVKDWIEYKPWDGVSRIEDLGNTLITPSDYRELSSILLKRWMTSIVAALYKPNFHNRGVLVLQGDQGIGKSTWLRLLLGPMQEYFKGGAHLDPRDKDTVISCTSKLLVELGELGATFKKADMDRLKAFITETEDEVRRPYARSHERLKRRTVFSASINEVEFLRDLTGNSRWWVIPCLKIDYQHTIDMQQVFAEYLGVYREGYQWWLTPEEEKRLDEQSASFQVEDPLKSRMDYHYDFEDGVERDLKVTSHEIFMEIGIDNPTRADSMKLGQLLKARSIRKGRSGAGNVYVNMPMKRRERR